MDEGLRIKKTNHMSQALRGKLVWRLAVEVNREWIKVCETKYLETSNDI